VGLALLCDCAAGAARSRPPLGAGAESGGALCGCSTGATDAGAGPGCSIGAAPAAISAGALSRCQYHHPPPPATAPTSTSAAIASVFPPGPEAAGGWGADAIGDRGAGVGRVRGGAVIGGIAPELSAPHCPQYGFPGRSGAPQDRHAAGDSVRCSGCTALPQFPQYAAPGPTIAPHVLQFKVSPFRRKAGLKFLDHYIRISRNRTTLPHPLRC
jgi:hypothetical protein